jgi:hypothetical protein
MKLNFKIYFFLFLNCLISVYAYSQDFRKVDSIIKKYPKSFSNPEKLASSIQKDFALEKDKARAIYTWIALNISYDLKLALNPVPGKGFSYINEIDKLKKIAALENEKIQTVFKKHTAVCSGFSLLYQRVATLVGLQSTVIEGFSKTITKDIGFVPKVPDHAWNAVLIDGKWSLIDVTWGSGYLDLNRNVFVKEFTPLYFDTNPAFFFAKHYPSSGVWLDKTVDENAFINGPLLYKNEIIEILEPKSGIIEVIGDQEITFRIKNVSKNDNLAYLSNGTLSSVKILNEELGVVNFTIDYKIKDGNYLTLYLYERALVSFKINHKQ